MRNLCYPLTPAAGGGKMGMLLGRGQVPACRAFVLYSRCSSQSGARKQAGRFSPEADTRTLRAPLCVVSRQEKTHAAFGLAAIAAWASVT